MTAEAPSPPRAIWKQENDAVVLELSGDWMQDGPDVKIEGTAPDQVPDRYDTSKLGKFDSTLPAFVLAQVRPKVEQQREKASEKSNDAEPQKDTNASLEGLPENLQGLMELALAVPEESDARGKSKPKSEIAKLGKKTIKAWGGLNDLLGFVGQSVFSLGRFVTGRAQFRSRDFWMVMQECGAQALPIVSLISFLIGMILAFVGNVQLSNFGANIYVADLVSLAMVREMGVVMTSIIMSGRTGAAFAAHLGSMKANEEIDALKTFGFDPFDFLVLPRLVALVVMMPILTIYANIIGILGGMLVGMFSGIPPMLFYNETLTAVTLTTASLGVMKSVFFGAAIAISGCLQGMKAGNSSAAVGQATTKAVVTSITAVIVLDSAFAAIFTILGI